MSRGIVHQHISKTISLTSSEDEIEKILNPDPDSTNESFVCEYCNEPMSKKRNKHQKTCEKYHQSVEKLNDNSYKCHHCEKSYVTRAIAYQHISRYHSFETSDEIETNLNPELIDASGSSYDQIENSFNPNEEKMPSNTNADDETEIETNR